MMKQGLIKRTHIDQVSNGTLAYEILISGDTYASLTYRSLRLPLYTEGATLDVNAKASCLEDLAKLPPQITLHRLMMLQHFRMAGNLPWMMRNSL